MTGSGFAPAARAAAPDQSFIQSEAAFCCAFINSAGLDQRWAANSPMARAGAVGSKGTGALGSAARSAAEAPRCSAPAITRDQASASSEGLGAPSGSFQTLLV